MRKIAADAARKSILMCPTRTSLRREVEQFLRRKIPLSRAMGVHVQNVRPMTLEAPIEPNINHLHTAFGGSINAVATLTAYAFLWLHLRQLSSVHVVVAESSIRFRRPVRRKLRAICLPPASVNLTTLKQRLARAGRAQIKLKVNVKEGRSTAAEFEGEFVAICSRRTDEIENRLGG